MLYADIKTSENMTAEEIEEAEMKLEPYRNLIKALTEWHGDWIMFGIDFSQIDSRAKDGIVIIGVENWKKGRGNFIEGLRKQFKETEEKLAKAKINLKEKQNTKQA